MGEAKRKGTLVLGQVNRVGSSIACETHAGVWCHPGAQAGAASTNSLLSQATLLILMALLIGKAAKPGQERDGGVGRGLGDSDFL